MEVNFYAFQVLRLGLIRTSSAIMQRSVNSQ